MATYEIPLIGSKEVAVGTMAFFFEKPAGFSFKPGQFIRFSLIDPPETDAEGDARTFSIASAPYEDELMIATRMRDTAFKRVLKSMVPGDRIVARGPYGSLTLHEDPSRPAVFLTGGIGITPFRSILLQAARDQLAHHLFLFYSNRRPEDAAFLEELSGLRGRLSRFTFVGAMTDMALSNRNWDGITGRIDLDVLKDNIGDLSVPVYYVAGPPGMVEGMTKTLSAAGAPDIRVERFAGY
jgi:ferredoxin-NADP reductase